MKPIFWVLIIIAGTLFPLIFMVVVPVIILNMTWWWVFGTLIAELIIGLILTAIFLYFKLSKKAPAKIKLDIKSAKEYAIHTMKTDPDNPDNFSIEVSKLLRIGERGAEKTPILHLKGRGTETTTERHAIINLNNPRKEMTTLINPTPFEVEDAINKIAEHPAEEKETEERTIGMDDYGRPVTKIVSRRVSANEKRAEEDRKTAEEAQAI